MEKDLERYELLCKDIKHQMLYIDDVYCFDFNFLKESLDEMKKLQTKILKKQETV
jgi:hypothetical protein